jgi:hypothetical protein
MCLTASRNDHWIVQDQQNDHRGNFISSFRRRSGICHRESLRVAAGRSLRPLHSIARSALAPLTKMSELPKFKFICDACGSMSIKVEQSDGASETTIVNCGRCSSPRGTLAALRYLARNGRSDLFEF